MQSGLSWPLLSWKMRSAVSCGDVSEAIPSVADAGRLRLDLEGDDDPCGQFAAQWPGWPHRKQLRLALALPFGSNFPPPCGGYLIVVEDLPDLEPPPFPFPLLLQPDGLVVGEVDEAGPCC